MDARGYWAILDKYIAQTLEPLFPFRYHFRYYFRATRASGLLCVLTRREIFFYARSRTRNWNPHPYVGIKIWEITHVGGYVWILYVDQKRPGLNHHFKLLIPNFLFSLYSTFSSASSSLPQRCVWRALSTIFALLNINGFRIESPQRF